MKETFLRVWNRIQFFEPGRGALGPWLLAIARSRAIDRIRVGVARRTAHEPIEHGRQVPCGRPGPEDDYAVAQRRRRVQAALAALPVDQRQAVELAYYDGLSHVEIAERLGDPLGTVKTRIRLGMHKLRVALSNPGSDLR